VISLALPISFLIFRCRSYFSCGCVREHSG